MRMRHSLPALALLGLLNMPSIGFAADMPGNYYAGKAQMMEYGSLWYVRGDVSFANYPGPDVYCGCTLQNSIKQDPGIVGGVGIGYQFQRFVRMDATFDYRAPSKVTFRSPDNSTGETSIKTFVGMINAYIDIPLAKNFTPYIGAGIGAAMHDTATLNKQKVVSPLTQPSSWDGASTVAAAWSVMAGMAYDVNPNLKLDGGYKYTNMGDAHSSKITNLSANDERYDFKKLTSHDVRIGFRYVID